MEDRAGERSPESTVFLILHISTIHWNHRCVERPPEREKGGKVCSEAWKIILLPDNDLELVNQSRDQMGHIPKVRQ